MQKGVYQSDPHPRAPTRQATKLDARRSAARAALFQSFEFFKTFISVGVAM
jgi:hypothetical protein